MTGSCHCSKDGRGMFCAFQSRSNKTCCINLFLVHFADTMRNRL